jgi:NAD(P)H-hydrate epimerase
MDIPTVTARQMAEIDRLMIEEYGILLIQMMENAGRYLAELCRRMLDGQVKGKRIAVVCGGGNNGGGGMVAARHLHNWGAEILLSVAAHPERIKEAPARQLNILGRMGVANQECIELEAVDLVVEALIGYGMSGDPSGAAAAWIDRINAARRPVLSLDAPAGLDTTTGQPGHPCIQASATLTLALPKTGLLHPKARAYVGKLYLADISVPPELYRQPTIGLKVEPIFTSEAIIAL